MLIEIRNRNSNNIETDRRISKYNFGSRRNYSIETALLEKRMIYDASKHDGKITIYNLTDLEACYDRQLPKVSGLVQEVVGVNQKCIKVIVNIISRK